LKKLHGKSTVEISQLMGISEKSVEKKINRALRDIESKMSAYF
ncbi:MAG: DNA-directed RNA polymerase specialized sigma24 family protein, partial [Zhongshania aliphaticivorans]